MNIVGTVIAVLFIITISNFVFKKFNILIDRTNISNHKSFINGHKTTPLLGGFAFFLILVFFLPENYQYLLVNSSWAKSRSSSIMSLTRLMNEYFGLKFNFL